jgi:glycosyltransferase involved in cell wall biosynthesis
MSLNPLTILIGPEEPDRGQAIAAHLAPRLDYQVIADFSQGRVQSWLSAPSGLSGSRLLRRGRSFFGNLAYALRLVRDLPPGSIVYSTGETWGLPLALAGAMLRRRHFTHVIYVHRVFSSTWLRFLYTTRHLLAVDGWICVTRYQTDLLRRALGPDGAPVVAISQGVDTTFLDPAMAGHPQSPPYILAVGAEMRNYDLLFEAVQGQDIRVVVKASSAWMTGSRHALTSIPANVQINTQRLSYVELRDLYAGATLVVVPLYETPQAAGISTILEGMAMQKCVIATQSNGLPAALVDWRTGLVVAPSAQDLWMAIETMWHEPESCALLARKGQRLVYEHYKLEDHAAAVSDFLSQVASMC